MLNSESLNKVLEERKLSRQEIIQIYENSQNNPSELFLTSQKLRDGFKKDTVTFSKKVFFNIINLCKDTCSYCTYKSEPSEQKMSMMSKQEIKQLLILAKKK